MPDLFKIGSPRRHSNEPYSGDIELEELTISEGMPTTEIGSASDIKEFCTRIRNIFKESQKLSQAQRHDCFDLINDLRSRLSIRPKVEDTYREVDYMHREVYLRQAENVRDNKSVITNLKSLASLDELARKYITSFSAFRVFMQSTEIKFFDLKERLTDLTQTHYNFSENFAYIYNNKRV